MASERRSLRGWTFSGIFTAQSGQPYSAYVNTDINGDGNTRNDIAPGTTRNQYRLRQPDHARPAHRPRHPARPYASCSSSRRRSTC